MVLDGVGYWYGQYLAIMPGISFSVRGQEFSLCFLLSFHHLPAQAVDQKFPSIPIIGSSCESFFEPSYRLIFVFVNDTRSCHTKRDRLPAVQADCGWKRNADFTSS